MGGGSISSKEILYRIVNILGITASIIGETLIWKSFYSLYYNYEDVYIPIFKNFPQQPATYNYSFPYLWFFPVSFLAIPVGMLLFFIISKYIYYVLKIKAKFNNFEINLFKADLDIKITPFKMYKYAFMTSLFSFNITTIIIQTFNLEEKLLYTENILGGEISILMTSYLAVLLISTPFTVGLFIAISILDWGQFYYEFSDYFGETVKIDNSSFVMRNYLKGFVGISTLFTLISIGSALYGELSMYYQNLSKVYIIESIGFIMLIEPIFLFPVFFLSYHITKRLRSIVSYWT